MDILEINSSPLLAHSNRPKDQTFFTTFVRPATQSELLAESKDGNGIPFAPVKFADKKAKLVFVDNPVCTDVTQAHHTDIHQILQQNPDVSGLSLILDDPAADAVRNSVQLEDFMQPSQYVDIFDVYDFVENSKRAFNSLPASLRKVFNNDPSQLVSALDRKDPAAYSAIRDYLGISESVPNSGSQGDVDSSSVSDNKASSKEPSVSETSQ